MTVSIPFLKASACGNDFLVIDGRHAGDRMVEITRQICDRHNGVGGDGVEWLFPDEEADVRARLLNADGSEAEISGNGTRCVAAHIADQQGKGIVTVRTGAGPKTCTLLERNGMHFEFETRMGKPQVSDELAVKVASGKVRGIPVSVGNPHFVVFVHDFAPDWQKRAAEIGREPEFKQGINIELVRVVETGVIDVRFYERGVGETHSSGTGSCAAAVASIATKRAQSPVLVRAPGGQQTVRWDGEVYLQGPAQILCRGEFFL